ncbi:MAG: hypothetical protein ACI8Q1_002953 [Parvicella sp.]|jgi:hypothetical protein
MNHTIQELHQAAQYLAAAGISFLEKKADDSNTNVGWNSVDKRLETHVFGNQDQLSLNLNTVKIEWLNSGRVISGIDLISKSHTEIVQWISEQAKENKIALPFTYNFHYDLPYKEITDDYRFSLSEKKLETISNELTKAQKAFEQFLDYQNLDSPIRIWPHHFDLGIYTKLESENTFMGAGLAIPDSLVNDFYFYASGYKNGIGIETKTYGKLNIGDWRSDWNGATLASKNVNDKSVLTFLNEVKNKFNQ